MDALILIQKALISTPCVRTLKDLMFVDVKRDILDMVETALTLLFLIVLLSMVMFSVFSFTPFTTQTVFLYFFTRLDLDECAIPNECDLNALCINTEGSYVCRCRKGFEGDGRNCTGSKTC